MNNIEFAGAVKENSYGTYFKDNFSSNGSPKDFNLERILANPQGNILDVVGLAKYYYCSSGVIMRTVNLIRDFGAGSPVLEYGKNKKRVKKVIEDFNKRINIEQVYKDIIFELALTGNCGGYNRDGKRIDIFPLSKYEVSPLIINNKQVLFFLNSEEFGTDGSIDEKLIDSALPEEVKKGKKKGEEKIQLNVENTFFCKTNGSRYEPYGITFLLPSFPELAHKNLLKQAENSSATGVIEQMLLIKIGDKDNKPSQKLVTYYNNLFNGKKGSLRAVVPYFIDGKWITPETRILTEEKFIQVDKDLLSALGVSLTLIRGEGGGSYSDGLLNITGLIKTIESLRQDLPTITEDWYKAELRRNNIPEEYCPIIKLPEIEIDKDTKRNYLQWLFQNAGLPYEVLYEDSGYDFESLKEIRKQENDEKVEDIFKLREQPFQGGNNVSDDVGRPKKELKDRKSDPEKSNNENPRTGRETIKE